VDNLEPLAKAKLPLLIVYGDDDSVVPHAENSEVVFERYKQLGGPVEPGQDRQPHGRKDVTPVIKFLSDALGVK
jgi:alpha-beta hydrolase superfamily lysophospholipase